MPVYTAPASGFLAHLLSRFSIDTCAQSPTYVSPILYARIISIPFMMIGMPAYLTWDSYTGCWKYITTAASDRVVPTQAPRGSTSNRRRWEMGKHVTRGVMLRGELNRYVRIVTPCLSSNSGLRGKSLRSESVESTAPAVPPAGAHFAGGLLVWSVGGVS
ncbi:hypothetical protein XU18_4597 [Perkinsela sp. CCAP 1560/4]|nr:hypothetical protein XU18_4597 [Perkinsela sp. CCAP 1560/4]|eukprot:KNH04101.1 hypothetical protein XU18_4597 [Perkinsela sp. CCAP 1560/4]